VNPNIRIKTILNHLVSFITFMANGALFLHGLTYNGRHKVRRFFAVALYALVMQLF
jgi:hypothetical protein